MSKCKLEMEKVKSNIHKNIFDFITITNKMHMYSEGGIDEGIYKCFICSYW